MISMDETTEEIMMSYFLDMRDTLTEIHEELVKIRKAQRT